MLQSCQLQAKGLSPAGDRARGQWRSSTPPAAAPACHPRVSSPPLRAAPRPAAAACHRSQGARARALQPTRGWEQTSPGRNPSRPSPPLPTPALKQIDGQSLKLAQLCPADDIRTTWPCEPFTDRRPGMAGDQGESTAEGARQRATEPEGKGRSRDAATVNLKILIRILREIADKMLRIRRTGSPNEEVQRTKYSVKEPRGSQNSSEKLETHSGNTPAKQNRKTALENR